MSWYKCVQSGNTKILYDGDVSLTGNASSSGSKTTSASIYIGEGLDNVKCAMQLRATDWYCGGSDSWFISAISTSCVYNKTTGYVTVSATVNTGKGGWHGRGEATAYLLVVQN